MVKDAGEIKNKIINILRNKGPMLPAYLAKEINLEPLFTSAFLSELFSEKKISLSHMKVGSSPIYFLEETKNQLEKFGDYLKSKEKEAFLLLKEKSFLEDIKQDPAIRIALRQIKDFAIPFKDNENLFWRYLSIPKSDFKPKEAKKEKPQEKVLDIFDSKKFSDKNKKELIFKPKKEKKKTKPRASDRKNEKFFNKVKIFLLKNDLEILDIEGFSRDNLTLKVKEKGYEKLLIAYNKKRLVETDIIKAHTKALEQNLPYLLLSLGEPSKKLGNFILAIKNLSSIGKIE